MTGSGQGRRRALRWVLAVAAILVLVPLGGFVVLWARFDPNAYKPEIEAAVRRATGRELTIGGPLHLRLALAPTVAAEDVALANLPGGSRPRMLTLRRVEASVALLPLLSGRVVIDSLTLVGPDLLLERDAAGRGNWQFTPASAGGAATGGAASPAPAPNAPASPAKETVAIRSVRLQDGRIAWRDLAGQTGLVSIASALAEARNEAAPLHLSVEGETNGLRFTLDGESGPLIRFNQQAGPAEAWPVRLSAGAAGARLDVSGNIADPIHVRGYDLRVALLAPDFGALASLAHGLVLPALHDLRFSAHLVDAAGDKGGLSRPALSDLTLHVGASDLAATAPGLAIAKADIVAPAPGQPARVEATGTMRGAPLHLAGTVGLPAPGGGAAPLPVDLHAESAGATLSARGTVPPDAAAGGLDLAVAARVPDLAALSAFAGRGLPALTGIALDTHVAAPGGVRQGVTLQGLRLTTAQGDLGGDLTLGAASPLSVRGTLVSNRLDLDALRTAARATPARPAGAKPAAAPGPTAPPVPALPAPRPASSRFVIPDTPLPFDALRAGNADLTLRAGTIIQGGATYHDLATHLLLQDRRLRLDPFAAVAPEGRVDGQLAVDAARTPPAVSLTLHSPGLALGPLLAGRPGAISGTAQLDTALNGAGRTPHELAAGLGGHFGLSLVNGQVENQVLAAYAGEVVRAAGIPLPVTGESRIRCFLLRIDFAGGEGTVRQLALDAGPLTLQGEGGINLAAESLALHVRPVLRVGHTSVQVPVRVGGTLRAPAAALDAMGAAGRVGIIIGGLKGAAPPDVCGGTAAATAQTPALPAIPGLPGAPGVPAKPPKPMDLLRRFLQ